MSYNFSEAEQRQYDIEQLQGDVEFLQQKVKVQQEKIESLDKDCDRYEDAFAILIGLLENEDPIFSDNDLKPLKELFYGKS